MGLTEVREHHNQWVAANEPDGRRNLGIQAANTASVYPSVFAALGVWLAPEKKAKKQAATCPSVLPPSNAQIQAYQAAALALVSEDTTGKYCTADLGCVKGAYI